MVRVITPLLSHEEEDALKLILAYLEDEKDQYIDLPPSERQGHIYHSVLVLRACSMVFPPLVDLGRTCSTPGAVAALERAAQEPSHFLSRHASGDWGEVSADDWRENQFSLENGFRILSAYRTATDERLWIITEADRSLTTLLLPEEY